MPMLLKGDDGKEFELALIKDPMLDPQDGIGDSAAAVISYRVATGDDEWEETAPCINVFEFDALVLWLRSVAGMTHDEAEVDLPECGLTFEVAEDDGKWVTIRVRFEAEDEGAFTSGDSEAPGSAAVDIRLPRPAVRVAAGVLRRDLRTFRGGFKDDLRGERDEGVRPAAPELGLANVDDTDELDAAMRVIERAPDEESTPG